MDINFFEVIDFIVLLVFMLYMNYRRKNEIFHLKCRVNSLEYNQEDLQKDVCNLNTAAPQPVMTLSSIKPNVLSRSARRRIRRRKERQALKNNVKLNDDSISLTGE